MCSTSTRVESYAKRSNLTSSFPRVCCGKVSLKSAVTAIAVFEFVVIGAAVIGPWIAGQILQAVLTGVGSLLSPMILMYGARAEVNGERTKAKICDSRDR